MRGKGGPRRRSPSSGEVPCERVEAMPAAAAGRSGGVDADGRDEPHLAGGRGHAGWSFDADLPPLLVDAVVASGAQQDAVVEVARPAVAFPPAEMMRFGEGGREVAGGASAVALDERESLSAGEVAPSAAEVED